MAGSALQKGVPGMMSMCRSRDRPIDTSRRHIVILDTLEQHAAEALLVAVAHHYLGIWQGLHPGAHCRSDPAPHGSASNETNGNNEWDELPSAQSEGASLQSGASGEL